MSTLLKSRFHKLISKFSTCKPLLVVGDIGVDKYTQGQVQRVSPEAPVPIVEVQKEWKKLGLAANVLDNLNALHIQGTLCGVCGNDKMGESLKDLLKKKNLHTGGIIDDDTRPTVVKERVGTPFQQICRIDYEQNTPIKKNIEESLLKGILDREEGHDGLIIEDYGKGVLTQSLLTTLIQTFREKKHLICVDPARTTPPSHYRGCTLLKPNQEEVSLMVEKLGYSHRDKNLQQMSEILSDKLLVEKIVITLGAKGMALYDSKGGFQLVPTVGTEVFDVSGAGDTAISVLTASLQAGSTLEEAAQMANLAASVVVKKLGTATVNLDELKAAYQKVMGP